MNPVPIVERREPLEAGGIDFHEDPSPMLPSPASRLVLTFCAACAFAPLSAAQGVPGPPVSLGVLPRQTFESGQRWRLDAPTATPWIPRSVAFAARGELVWSGPSIANPQLLLASTAGDSTTAALLQDDSPVGAIGPVLVCAGDETNELFSLVQMPFGSNRRTVVMGHDPTPSVLSGSAFRSSWTYNPGVATDRPSLLECGTRADAVVVATFSSASVHVDWLDPADGCRLSRVSVAGTGLSAMAYSEASERIALIAGLDLWVIDRAGTVWHHEPILAGTSALAIAADGKTVAYGDFGLVRLLTETSGVFVEGAGVTGLETELPTRVALDGDGETLAVGWWRFSNGIDIRLEVWDLAQNNRLVLREQTGPLGGYQNFPEVVKLAEDGSRVAFGLWGLSDSQPELLLVDVSTDTDLLAVDLPGSIRALALDETGTRVALGAKDKHANDFATTGSVRLFDTGERDLQLLEPPVRGGMLSLATLHPGQLYTVVLLGCEASSGSLVSGWSGLNWIDTTKPFLWRGAVPDGKGFSIRQIGIPDQPSLVGLEFGVQAVFVRNSGVSLSEELLHPVIF